MEVEKDRAEQRRAPQDARVQGRSLSVGAAPEFPCHSDSGSVNGHLEQPRERVQWPHILMRKRRCVFAMCSINDVCFVTRGPSRDHTSIDAL